MSAANRWLRWAAIATKLTLAMLVGLRPAVATADTITSGKFFVTFGATYINGAANSWTTTENASVNTATTIGDFSFVPTIQSGRAFTQNGPTFNNGILTTGGTTNVTGNATDFALSLTGSHQGLVPPGATDLTLTLNITRLSVWGWSSTTHTAVTNMYFSETTAGHAVASPSVNLRSGVYSPTAVANAANYTQLIWDPADFAVALTASTRTFNLNGGGVALCIDGLTVQGNVVLTYVPAASPPPEPPAGVGQGTLLADPFATGYAGDLQNTELSRQSGLLAPLTYSDLPFAANSWQSRLSGTGLVLYPSRAYPSPGVRLEHNFTNSGWLRFSVDIDAITNSYWGGMAIGCSSTATNLYDPNGSALKIFANGSVLAISQGSEFIATSVPASDSYHVELESTTPPSSDGSGVATLRASINGWALDLNGGAPGVSICRPAFSANYVLLEATRDLPDYVAAARFRNLIVTDMRPSAASAGVLLQDSFHTAYTGNDVNRETPRQTGAMAPVAYVKTSSDPAGEWRSALSGNGLSLTADSGYLAAVRTAANFTNFGHQSYSVRVTPSDYRPHNRFGVGCGPSDMDPNTSPTGIGVMIWGGSGHLFVYDRGTTIYDGILPALSSYRINLEVNTPPAYDGSGLAIVDLAVNGIPLDLNGAADGTSYSRPGLTVNHLLMAAFIAAAGTNTVFDELVVRRVEPAPAPGLCIQPAATNQVRLSWPAVATRWRLEQSPDLGRTNWSVLAEPTADDGTNLNLVLTPAGLARFFRLHLDPSNPNLTNDAATVTALVPDSQVLVATNAGLWPTLLRLTNGTLLAFGHNQPGHTTLPGDEDCWASSDGGVSWQERASAAPRASTNANWVDSCAGPAANGDVLLLTAGYLDPGGARRALSAPGLFRSSDNGLTWIRRGFFPAFLPRGEVTRPYGQIVQGADGTLRTIAYDQFNSGAAYMLLSRDDGLNWAEATLVGSDVNESVLLEISAGHWLAVGRTVSKPAPLNGQEMRQFRSRDNGQTWSDEGLVAGYSKHPPKLLRLQDGRLLLSYCNRRNGAIEVRFSADQGQTWSVPCSVAQAGGDRGYPDSVQLSDGRVVTVYYAQSTELYAGYQMAAVVWRLPALAASVNQENRRLR